MIMNGMQGKLNRVLGYLSAKCPQSWNDILQMEEHQGELTIHWKEEPSPFVRAMAVEAWKSHIGEGLRAGNVHHFTVPT